MGLLFQGSQGRVDPHIREDRIWTAAGVAARWSIE